MEIMALVEAALHFNALRSWTKHWGVLCLNRSVVDFLGSHCGVAWNMTTGRKGLWIVSLCRLVDSLGNSASTIYTLSCIFPGGLDHPLDLHNLQLNAGCLMRGMS